MFRPFLPFVLLSCLLMTTLSVSALELKDLHLPMTRNEADTTLSKDYSYCVLEDMTVRRTWSLDTCEVSVDFNPKQGDEALIIFIDYDTPVPASVAARDASQLIGANCDKWTRLNASRAERLGLENPEGVKVNGGRFCFRARNDEGLVTRLAYYASVPKEIRWELKEDERDSGHTALGSRAGGTTEYLWKDEERRRTRIPVERVVKEPLVKEALVEESVAEEPVEEAAAPAPRKKGTELKLDDEPKPLSETIMETAKTVDPLYYGIAGGVLLLLLIVRFIRNAREEKRRQMVANYIMNRGKIDVPGQKRRK